LIRVNDILYEVLRVFRIWPEDPEQHKDLMELKNKNKDITIVKDVQNYYICKEIEDAIFTEIEIED